MAEDYPRTLLEFEDRFATDQACRDYLIQLRWPHGFVCPHCGARTVWAATRGRLVCAGCRHQTSVTAGTIFHDTRKPLRLWFRAMWYVTSQKNGASAMGLQRVLGLGSYLTAWTWLHKLRRAMVRPGRDRLSGRVEVDETYVGGEEPEAHARQILRKSLVAIAAQEDGRGIGRIRMAGIPMDGKGTAAWRKMDTIMKLRFCVDKVRMLPSSCFRGFIGSRDCSNAGCWELTKGLSVGTIWIITWMNSRFDSIAENPVRGASCSIGW